MMKTAAICTINSLPDMTQEGKNEIVKWLRKQANFVNRMPADSFSKKYIVRYLYEESK